MQHPVDAAAIDLQLLPAVLPGAVRRRVLAAGHRRRPAVVPAPPSEEVTAETADAATTGSDGDPPGSAVGVTTPAPMESAPASQQASAPAATDLAGLADALYPRLVRRMRHEILLDRERRGLRVDRRPS